MDLDLRQIQEIREKARLSVISATLILHVYTVTKTEISSVNINSMSSEAKYWKKKLNETLNSYLPIELRKKEVSGCITEFAQSKYCSILFYLFEQGTF